MMTTNPNAAPNKTQDYLELLAKGAALLALFGGVAYFLGRQYVEAYYSCFGIPKSLIFLTPNDYMFFSFPVIVMSLGASFWLFVIVSGIRKGSVLIWDSSRRLSGQWENVVLEVLIFMFCVVGSIAIIGGNSPSGFNGLLVGYSTVGILRYVVALLMVGNTAKERSRLIAFRIASLFAVVLTMLPILTQRVAELDAISEFRNIPSVKVISGDLPKEIVSPVEDAKQNVETKLLLINDGKVYLFRGGLTHPPDNPGASIISGQVYVAKLSDIKYITIQRK